MNMTLSATFVSKKITESKFAVVKVNFSLRCPKVAVVEVFI